MKKIKSDAFTVLWIIIIIYAKGTLFIPLFSAILLHELGHVLASLLMGVRIKRLHLSLLGARMELSGEIPYAKELIIALAGPAIGLLGYALANRSDSYSNNIRLFALISLCLGIFNLLPIRSLDGGRIAECILCSLLPLHIAQAIMQITSFMTLFAFWILSVYMMIKYAGGLSAFVFCLIFFSKCFIFDAKKRDLKSF